MQWYAVVSLTIVFCRIAIRFAAGLIRKFGYNTRYVAVAGSMPAGINLLRSFEEEPWLGFVVKGVYDDQPTDDESNIIYAGTLSDLISEAKAGKLDRIYIAMRMGDEEKLKT